MTITSTEADRMMNLAAFIYLRNSDSFDADEATEFAREMFKEFCTIEGITEVEYDEEEDDDNDEICEEDYDIEMGFNPYIGGYDYDC